MGKKTKFDLFSMGDINEILTENSTEKSRIDCEAKKELLSQKIPKFIFHMKNLMSSEAKLGDQIIGFLEGKFVLMF